MFLTKFFTSNDTKNFLTDFLVTLCVKCFCILDVSSAREFVTVQQIKSNLRRNTAANENNEKIHCEDVQNDAPKFLKIRIFWRSFWLQTALKNFLRIFSSRYEYVKCCPRSYLSSAFWIMVIQRTNPFLFGKVLTPPVTLDLGAASFFLKFVYNFPHKTLLNLWDYKATQILT